MWHRNNNNTNVTVIVGGGGCVIRAQRGIISTAGGQGCLSVLGSPGKDLPGMCV